MPAVPGEPAQRLDVRGLALLAPALGALVHGLSYGIVVALAVGIGLVAAFVMHALRTESPLIDVRLFTQRSFAGATVMLFLLSGSLFGSMVLVPLYVQQVRGAGALAAVEAWQGGAVDVQQCRDALSGRAVALLSVYRTPLTEQGKPTRPALRATALDQTRSIV